MNINELRDALQELMPGVELGIQLNMSLEIIVTTSLESHECMPDDTQKLTTQSGLEFDAFALGDAIRALLPDSEFCDDDHCRSFIMTGLSFENAELEPCR